LAVLAGSLLAAILVALVIEVERRRRDTALALYVTEHQVAETLQRSLLPELPTVPGLGLSARYLAGTVERQVGGDWFDVFPIPGGQVGVVIGDVVGHDLIAAAAMSQVRATLRAYAWTGGEPGAVLDQVEQLVTTFAVTPLLTVFYGVLDPPDRSGNRRLRFSNAGHLPPFIRSTAGEVEALPNTFSVLMGGLASPLR
jgi:serine phosphatase RsbU (regulator of sigma subunit)